MQEVKLPDDLMKAAQSIKDHLNYHLSGRWARDGVEKGKNPYSWMHLYDYELGVRVHTFQPLFHRASKDEKEGSVKIFLDELNRFLQKAPDFPELWEFHEEVTNIGPYLQLNRTPPSKLIRIAELYLSSAFFL